MNARLATSDTSESTRTPEVKPPRRGPVGLLIGLGTLAVLASLPFVPFGIPGVFSGPFSSPGTLQVLGIALVLAGFAISYDLLFGYTGLLSFGHGLYFAFGVYGTNLLMHRAELPYALAALIAVSAVVVLSSLFGSIALRVRGVAFAMVTLAFAEAFHVFVLADPLRVSGGEEGMPLATGQVPSFLLGVMNLRNIYWLALLFAAISYVVAWMAVSSRAGRVWQAIRENEDRVELLGMVPFGFKLTCFTLSSTLAAFGGSIYLLLVRGSTPQVASALFTLALLVMVTLGGLGRLWGAAIGGLVYGVLNLRLAAMAQSGVFDGLPDWLEGPLTEPLFILGVLFMLLVLFAPGGAASLVERVTGRVLLPARVATGEGRPAPTRPVADVSPTHDEPDVEPRL